MTDAPDPATSPEIVVLRKTRETDLGTVIAIERHPDNAPFIGQWTEEQHLRVIRGEYGEHWVVTSGDDAPTGFLMAYDLTLEGFGVWLQRIAVTDKSRGVGRAVLGAFLAAAMSRYHANIATLDVMPINQRAQGAYRAVGFEVVDLGSERQRLVDLLGGLDEDGIIMQVSRSRLRTEHGVEVQTIG